MIARIANAASDTALNWGMLLLLSLVWGGSFIAVEMALPGFPPLTLAAIRIGLGALALAPLSFALGHGLPTLRTPTGRRIWLHCLGMALFSNAIPFSLLSWGQQQVTSGFAGITMAAVPLLVLPLSHFMLPGERMTPRKVLGFAIGFVGVAVLISPGALPSADGGSVGLAQGACVLASCCYAIGAIVTRLCPPVQMVSFSAGALILATVVLTPVALIVERPFDLSPSAESLAAAVYLGLFPTALATLLLVTVIHRAGPPFLSLVNYMVPVWAVAFGVVLLGEAVEWSFAVALALILLGVAIAQNLLFRRR